MENHQQQPNLDEDGGTKGSFHCRQNNGHTRWTPTSEQIRILKDLYYNNGVRSPTADQIQKISAKLRQYGKVEGKNVFYWFQNHKARERQKNRFIASTHHHHSLILHHNIPTSAHVPYPSSAVGDMHIGNYGYGYGPYGYVTMENSFRDCSISSSGSGSSTSHNLGWDANPNYAIDPYTSSYTTAYNFFDQNSPMQEEDEENIETLPLFPMHGEADADADGRHNIYNPNTNNYSYYYGSQDVRATSLELSLNSYTTTRSSSDFM